MKRVSLLSLCLLVLGAAGWAQEVGDYQSRLNGNWRNVNTWQTWNGTAWVNAAVKPGPANNVKVLAGDTVVVAASPDSCRNLAVETGGTLYCNNVANRYLHVYGDSIANHGTLGGATDGLSFQFYNNLRISGSGATDLARIRPGAPARTLAIGQDIVLHFAGAALTCNMQDSTSFVVEAGVALIFGPASFFSLKNNGTTADSLNARITIAGTVTLQPGMNFNMSVQPGYASSLTMDGGTLNLGDSLVCSQSSTFGSETIVINQGGAINWTSADSLYVDTLVLNSWAGFSPGFPMRVRKLELRKGLYDNSVNNLRVHANGGTILRDSGTIAMTPNIFNSINVVYTGPQAFISGPELPEATPTDYTRLRSLTVTDGASLTLTKDIFCTHNLYLDGGTIDPGAFSMGVKDTAFRYSGHVIGSYYSVFDTLNPVETYHVGTANGYTPVIVTLDTVYGEGALTVNVTEGESPRPDSAQNTLKRYWTISPYFLYPVAFDSATITFTYLDDDFNTGLTPAEEGAMVIGKYDTGWSFPPVTGRDPAGNALTVGGVTSFSEFVIARDSASIAPTGVSGRPAPVSGRYSLSPVSPNPVRNQATLRYSLAKAGRVSIAVYNVMGQKVRTLVNGTMNAGYHSVNWDGRNEGGQAVAAGVYMYQMQAEGFNSTRKLVVIR